MRTYLRTGALAIVALAITFMAAGTSNAAFDKDELKCRKGMSKGMLKAISTADKTSAGCHKSRHSEKIGAGVDCNDLGPEPGTLGAADTKGKFAKSQQKLIDTPAKKCLGLDGDVLGEFIACPEPCATDLGLGSSFADLDEVASCMACMAGDFVSTKNATLLGSPDPTLMSKDDAKCAQTIAKGYSKYLSTILKTRTKCQDGIEKEGGMGLDSNCQNSADPDGKGKIAKALTKAEDGLDKSCPAATLANVGGCSAADIATLKTCSAADTDATDVASFPAHYELGPTSCPASVRSTVLSGSGPGGSSTNSFLEVGWTGDGHNFDIPGGYTFEADVTCPNGAPPCGTCTIDGIKQSGADYERFTRCTNDITVRCDEPFQLDADDCGGSFCTYILGPPLPISAGGSPTCSINALALDVSGTLVVETGDAELNIDLSTRVSTPGVVLVPCPVCQGDVTPNDDVQDGVCAGGSSADGMPCDVNGFDETFASASNNEGLSLDCVPPGATNISGSGLQINLALTTGSHSLGANNACDAPLGFLDCFCGVCSGDTSIGCRDDGECAAVAAGTCTAKGGNGVNRQPNQCNNFANCVDVGNERGECSDSDFMFCSGISKASGLGLVPCIGDGDCDSTCGGVGACGTCSTVQPRACFLDPIEGTGVADPGSPTMVANFCLPPTINAAINGVTGSPGPGRVAIQQDIEFIY